MFFGFSFSRNRNRYIFFEQYEVPTVLPFINFFCKGSFFFGQYSKCLSADCLRCERRRFYKVTSVGLVSYILADLGPRGELLKKQTSFLVQTYAQVARITSQNFASLFSLARILLASLHKMKVRAQHQAIFEQCASKPTKDNLKQDKMANMIAAGAHSVSKLQL